VAQRVNPSLDALEFLDFVAESIMEVELCSFTYTRSPLNTCECIQFLFALFLSHKFKATRAPPPKNNFLRSGKNQCDIWAKHYNFGKIWYAVKKFLYSCENYVMLGNFFYVRQNFRMFTGKFLDMSGKFFWYVPKNFLVCSEKNFFVCPDKIFWWPVKC
jgi:hypothetical protein